MAKWGISAVRRMRDGGEGRTQPPPPPREGGGEEEGEGEREGEGEGGWTLVEASVSALPLRGITRREAFAGLEEWEARRVGDHRLVAQRYASLLALLQRQTARGKEELSECLTFLSQRMAADGVYAASIARHKLGGRGMAEWANCTKPRDMALGESSPLTDSSGNEELGTVRAVLGCMTVQCAEKLQRFAADETIVKELAGSQLAYAAGGEAVCGSFGVLVEEINRANRGCVDAFHTYRQSYEDLCKREAQSEGKDASGGGRDLWLAECFYRSDVSTFHEKLWQVKPIHSLRVLVAGARCMMIPKRVFG